jgi:hypothetical protein
MPSFFASALPAACSLRFRAAMWGLLLGRVLKGGTQQHLFLPARILAVSQ